MSKSRSIFTNDIRKVLLAALNDLYPVQIRRRLGLGRLAERNGCFGIRLEVSSPKCSYKAVHCRGRWIVQRIPHNASFWSASIRHDQAGQRCVIVVCLDSPELDQIHDFLVDSRPRIHVHGCQPTCFCAGHDETGEILLLGNRRVLLSFHRLSPSGGTQIGKCLNQCCLPLHKILRSFAQLRRMNVDKQKSVHLAKFWKGHCRGDLRVVPHDRGACVNMMKLNQRLYC